MEKSYFSAGALSGTNDSTSSKDVLADKTYSWLAGRDHVDSGQESLTWAIREAALPATTKTSTGREIWSGSLAETNPDAPNSRASFSLLAECRENHNFSTKFGCKLHC